MKTVQWVYSRHCSESVEDSRCAVVVQVEMVYSLLSMLGTHDKDDMSRTLLAMSSSQDSCIAMRQSGGWRHTHGAVRWMCGGTVRWRTGHLSHEEREAGREKGHLSEGIRLREGQGERWEGDSAKEREEEEKHIARDGVGEKVRLWLTESER